MKALIFGGSGQLGRSMVQVLKGWSITNVDVQPNTDSQENIIFANQSIEHFKQELNELDKFNCIICVAGGWVGGGIKDEDLIQKYEDQYKKHIIPALYCSSLATTHLKQAGLLIFTGAYSVFSGPTPQSIAYALAKTAVHTIAAQVSASKELPQDSAVITLLPDIIDTPSNRLAMPKEDFTKWADPDQISGLVRAWSEGLNRPKNGAFVHLRVKNGTIAPDYL